MKRTTLIVSSREEDGAIITSPYNLSSSNIVSNDSFTIRRSEGFNFSQYEELFLSVPTATLWYNTPNVFATDYPAAGSLRNNQLIIKYWESRNLGGAAYDGYDDAGPSHPEYKTETIIVGVYITGRVRTITCNLPEGLYNLDSMNSYLNNYLNKQLVPNHSGTTGIYGISDQLVYFEGNPSDSKIDVHLQKPSSNFVGVPIGTIITGVYFNSISPNNLLGIELIGGEAQYEMVTTADLILDTFTATLPNVARFNITEYYYINSNIVDSGIPVNGQSGYVICMVQIGNDQEIGTQIQHKDFCKQYIDATSITVGAPRKELSFWLTDQTGKRVNTMGEDWSCRIDFEGTLKPDAANKRARG